MHEVMLAKLIKIPEIINKYYCVNFNLKSHQIIIILVITVTFTNS